MAGLFRKEVLEARQSALYGRVVLRSPLSFAWWCFGSALAAGAVIALLCFGQYTRRTRIPGVTVPSAGVLKLATPQPGIVVERHVEEGQQVRAGQVLFVVSSERFSDASSGSGGAHAATLEQMDQRRASLLEELEHRIQLLQRQNEALARRRSALEREAAQLEQELETQAAREESAGEQAARFGELAQRGFVSPVTARQRGDELLEQRARRQSLQRALLGIRREIEMATAELGQFSLRVAQQRAEARRELARLQQEIVAAEAARRIVVTAPHDGVITAIAAERGHHVGTSALATLLPTDVPMEAQLFAPSRSVGFVQPGQRVRVRFAAYPFQKFGQYDGEVVQVSRVALAPAEWPAQLAPPGVPEPLYRVTVRLASGSVMAYGAMQPLTAGMQLEADVMQDRRRLIEWVFEPLIALGRKRYF